MLHYIFDLEHRRTWRGAIVFWLAYLVIGFGLLFASATSGLVEGTRQDGQLWAVLFTAGLGVLIAISKRMGVAGAFWTLACLTGGLFGIPAGVLVASVMCTRDSRLDANEVIDARLPYVERHWRGDLSLARSYWVNTILLTVPLLAVISGVGSVIEISAGLLVAALLLAWVWLVISVFSTWQLVGVWRSAGNHVGRGGRRFWSVAVKVLVLIGVIGGVRTVLTEGVPQVREAWLIAFGDPEMGPHSITVLASGNVEFRGGITFGTANELELILSENPSATLLHLNSHGGRVTEALRMHELVRARGLFTYSGEQCASACTIVFVAGARRYVGPNAVLGFHKVSAPGIATEFLLQENNAIRDLLVARGVSPEFADRAQAVPPESMWWPTPDELRRANFITGIIEMR